MPKDTDSYFTVASEATVEIKIKASRFIGEVCPASTLDEALIQLEAIRKREYAATHHCFAWRGDAARPSEFKYSDDGEPSGTAGKPIYDVLCGAGLVRTLVVVTRYFGGTKLGTGGLVHAYGDAARAVLQQAGSREHFLTFTFRLKFNYSLYDQLNVKLHKLEATVLDSQFADTVTLCVEIRRSRDEQFQAMFMELTAGKGICERIG